MTDIVDKSEAPARRGYLATSHAPGCVPTVPSNKLNCGGCRRLNGSVFGRLEATCWLRSSGEGYWQRLARPHVSELPIYVGRFLFVAAGGALICLFAAIVVFAK